MKKATLVTIAALAAVGLAATAHAGGKRLPKAVSLVESIRGTVKSTHFVRTASAKPAPVQHATLRLDRPYRQTHHVREMAAAR
jgi:hypothetical protein